MQSINATRSVFVCVCGLDGEAPEPSMGSSLKLHIVNPQKKKLMPHYLFDVSAL